MTTPKHPRLPVGAIWVNDAALYKVEVRMQSGSTITQPVLARSMVAAHNIALRSLQELGETDILFVKSITLIEAGSEL